MPLCKFKCVQSITRGRLISCYITCSPEWLAITALCKKGTLEGLSNLPKVSGESGGGRVQTLTATAKHLLRKTAFAVL